MNGTRKNNWRTMLSHIIFEHLPICFKPIIIKELTSYDFCFNMARKIIDTQRNIENILAQIEIIEDVSAQDCL